MTPSLSCNFSLTRYLKPATQEMISCVTPLLTSPMRGQGSSNHCVCMCVYVCVCVCVCVSVTTLASATNALKVKVSANRKHSMQGTKLM